jgi:hypothetical protein
MGRRRVDRLLGCLQSGAFVSQHPDDFLQIADIACQPVDPSHHESVARAYER